MGTSNKHSTTPKPKNPTTSSDETDDQNPNPNPTTAAEPLPPFSISGAEEDLMLSKSQILTRQEVLKRRHRRLKDKLKLYEDYYWAVMEDYRVKHRDYYWNYGKSPVQEPENKKKKKKDGDGVGKDGNFIEGSGEVSNGKVGGSDGEGKSRKCRFIGCKVNAMALTSYCHGHILLDSKQRLYKPCSYVIKSQNMGPVHCGKPILRSIIPSLCTVHFEKAQAHVTRALKKVGLNISSASKLAPKLHLIVAESVRQINAKRRERRISVGNDAVMVENGNAGNGVGNEENTD